MMRIEENMLTPEIFRDLFLAVGWEPPGREQVERALESSLRTFTAYDGGPPVWRGCWETGPCPSM